MERLNITDVIIREAKSVEVNITIEGEYDSLWIFVTAKHMNNKEKQVYAFGVVNLNFSLVKMQVSSHTSSESRSLVDAIKGLESL